MNYIKVLFLVFIVLLLTYYTSEAIQAFKNPYYNNMKWIIPFYNWFFKK